jgi:hypothetical protein
MENGVQPGPVMVHCDFGDPHLSIRRLEQRDVRLADPSGSEIIYKFFINSLNSVKTGMRNQCSSAKDLHHFIAEVIDHFHGDAAGLRLVERTRGVAVER